MDACVRPLRSLPFFVRAAAFAILNAFESFLSERFAAAERGFFGFDTFRGLIPACAAKSFSIDWLLVDAAMSNCLKKACSS